MFWSDVQQICIILHISHSQQILNTNIYTVELTNDGADTSNMSFKELLGAIKWKTLLDNFSSWIGSVNFVKIIKDIFASLVALFASMG